MSLVAGTRLGPYEIQTPIGAGGMGEVYRARDTQLEREVAVKVLFADIALDAERFDRFEREARALAALNHPHIAQVYGMAREGDVRGIVMELVDGPTLAERLTTGPIPLDEALPLARQLADALEYAHERGIVHRDLKPANIKLTADGAAKVLDFGLAKILSGDAAVSSADVLGNSPTMASPGYTRVGVILGTAAYMAPEQARGAVVDRRADIWGFGAVLFEMLTGKPCFAGETVTDLLAAVVKTEPEWDALPADTSPRLRELLQRCLAKDRRQRLRDIGDARLELDSLIASGTEAEGSREAPRSRWRVVLPWVIAAASLLALAAVLAAVLAGLWPRVPTPDRRVVRFQIAPPPGISIPGRPNAASIAPDARAVAFVGEREGRTAIWVRPLAGLDGESWMVPRSEGAVAAPFWKPDGRHIAFAVPGLLQAADVESRTTIPVAPLPAGTDLEIDGAWGPAGDIVFGVSASSSNFAGNLFWVRAGGGDIRVLDRGRGHDEENLAYPQFLPDGRLLASIFKAGAPMSVRSVDLATGTTDPRAAFPVPAPGLIASGRFIHGGENTLVARRFEEPSLGLGKDVAVITGGVEYTHQWGYVPPNFSVARNGVLLYRAGSLMLSQFSVVDRRGAGTAAPIGEPGEYLTFALSHDGATIAVGRGGNHSGIWKIDTATGKRALLYPSGEAGDAAFDGRGHVTFGRGLTAREVLEVPIAGGSPTRLLTGEVFHDRTRDGTGLLVGELNSLRIRDARDPTQAVTLFDDARMADQGRFSPDGRTVAYNSSESGHFEVYVVPVQPTGQKTQVSSEGGVQPEWRADGRELFYLSLDGTLTAVDIDCRPNGMCRVGAPLALFKTGIRSPSHQVEEYASTGDGQRFVILGPASSPGPLTVLLNWPELVK